MPFFQEAKNFDIRGGSFQDMQEQHNYTDDRSFKITGDGNETHYAPDHSIADNRLYDNRTLTTPGHAPPPPTNPHGYMQSPAFIPSQAGPTQPSAVEQLQGEIQLLQLQLQRHKLQQEIAASTSAQRPQNLVNQEPGGPYLLQHQHTQQQYLHTLPQITAIPQHYTSATGPDIYSGQAHQSYINPLLQGLVPPQPIPPHNLLTVPPSRPATAEPPSSIASTSSGGDLGPATLLAVQSPTVPQSSAVAAGMFAQTHSISNGPPSGLLPPVVVAPIATLPGGTVPTGGMMQVNQGVGVVQGNVPVAVEAEQKKKKKRSLLSRLLRKLGLKKKS